MLLQLTLTTILAPTDIGLQLLREKTSHNMLLMVKVVMANVLFQRKLLKSI